MTKKEVVASKTEKEMFNELEALVKENKKTNREILKRLDKFELSLKRFYLIGYIRFLLIAIPIAIAILYLVPVIRDFLHAYSNFFDLIGEVFGEFDNSKLFEILGSLKGS